MPALVHLVYTSIAAQEFSKEKLNEILKQARNDGLMTLREAAIKKLAKSQTSFDEVLRVTVED